MPCRYDGLAEGHRLHKRNREAFRHTMAISPAGQAEHVTRAINRFQRISAELAEECYLLVDF